MAGGFRSPLFVLGLAAGVTQAGFVTPLPTFPAGGNAAVQAGFVTPLPTFPAGAGVGADPVPVLEGGSWGGRDKRADILYEEDELMLAVASAFLEMVDDVFG